MSTKKELVKDLAGALVAIFVGCIIFIYIIVNIPGTKELDGALIANVFTGGVTLFASIAAYYLLADWKEQFKFGKKFDFILEIRKEMRELQDDLGKLRIIFPLDIQDDILPEALERANTEYSEAISKFENSLEKIKDLFEDLNFLLSIKDTDRNKINNQITNLVGFSIKARKAHNQIYKAKKTNMEIKITENFAYCRAAYDSLYDGSNIETEDGIKQYDEGTKYNTSIKNLKNICYELYEEGSSKNRSLLNRLLDK